MTKVAFLAAFFAGFFAAEAALNTRTQTPVITSVFPGAGGLMGGTKISIFGANFAQNGLNTQYAVYIGDEQAECVVDAYHSNDKVIVCSTPVCSSTNCLATSDFRGGSVVPLNIYVQTVETIVGASVFFSYNYSITPYVLKMSKTVWPTGTGFVYGRMSTTETTDISISLSNGVLSHLALVGDPDELNPTVINAISDTQSIFYQPSSDTTGGFLNLSLTTQNKLAFEGPGLANLFSWGIPLDLKKDYTTDYNFDASPSGVVFTTALLPVVSSISPNSGSIGGGTTVTINGHGFSSDFKQLEVFIAGTPCRIKSATVNKITCVSGAPQLSDNILSDLVVNSSPFILNSSRPYGSAGAFVRLWKHNDPKFGIPSKAVASYPWRSGLDLSFYYYFGGAEWPSNSELSQLLGGPISNSNPLVAFDSELQTLFVAPYTGSYVFYLTASYTSSLFSGSNLLAFVSSNGTSQGEFYSNPSQVSVAIHLERGQRYPLRLQSLNVGKPDYATVAMKATPDLNLDGTLYDWNHNASQPGVITARVSQHLPDSLVRLKSVKEIQRIAISYVNQYQRQSLTINGVTSAGYQLVMVENTVTVPTKLYTSSTAITIQNALNKAAANLNPSDFPGAQVCKKFNVLSVKVVSTGAGTSSVTIVVEYVMENQQDLPVTYLSGYLPSGDIVPIPATNIQSHSYPLTSGTFTISLPNYGTARLNYNANGQNVQSALEQIIGEASGGMNVSVVTSGDSVTGYTFDVTFIRPLGSVGLMSVDLSFIVSAGASAKVTRLQAGSKKSLWFDPIPSWMTEQPLEWMVGTELKHTSSVELFLTSGSDSLKAVCDNTGSQLSQPAFSNAGFASILKGDESGCQFSYSSIVSPIITSSNISSFSSENTANVIIEGRDFLSFSTNTSKLSVIIGGINCLILTVSNSQILCNVSSVPKGSYFPEVFVPNLGNAVITNSLKSLLVFPLEVFSLTQVGNSVAGGGVVTIKGRGFSFDSVVVLADGSSCIPLTTSPSLLTCRLSSVLASTYNTVFNSATESSDPAYFGVIIDGVKTSFSVSYDRLNTPYISDITPNILSFAVTTIVSLTGTNLQNSENIMIGGEKCEILTNGETSISCKLLKHNDITSNYFQDVIVSVVGFGYASDLAKPTFFPSIVRGFHITNVSPSQGSYYGGNILTVKGVGFTESNISAYSVNLLHISSLGKYLNKYQYNQILALIGRPPVGEETIACSVLSASLEEITCQLPLTPAPSQDTQYVATVSLNGMNSICYNVTNNSTLCSFYQEKDFTPSITSAVIDSATSDNSLTLKLSGKLFGSSPSVWVNDQLCTIISSTDSLVVVSTPPISGGKRKVLLKNNVLGFSNFVTITAPLSASSSSTLTSSVSVAGGAILTINGTGFAAASNSVDCDFLNAISLKLSGLSVQTISNNGTSRIPLLQSCTNTQLTVLLPSIIDFISDSASISFPVSEIEVIVNGAKTKVSASFSFSKSASPQLTLPLASQSGFASQSLLFSVEKPSISSDNIIGSVKIGDLACTSISHLSNTINTTYTCSAPELSAGSHNILVNVPPYGNAILSGSVYSLPVFKSLLSVQSYVQSSTSFSTQGGESITLSGKGLGSLLQSVKVCDQSCSILSSTYSSVTCSLPQVSTILTIEDTIAAGIDDYSIITITDASYYSSDSGISEHPVSKVFDGDYNTYFQAQSVNCFVGISIPSNYVAMPFRMSFYPKIGTGLRLGDVSFQASKDGVNFETIGTILGSELNEGWNYITVEPSFSTQWYSNFRFVPINTTPGLATSCALEELSFMGTVALNETFSSSCPITVFSKELNEIKSAGKITYAPITSTPAVFTISPNNATALGGTTVTLHGKNFLSGSTGSYSDISVLFSGINCVVQSATATSVICVTGARSPSQIETMSIKVFVDGVGEAIVDDNAEFLYIDRWSERTSWLNGELPVTGDLVLIPEGQVILLDVDTPVLTALIVEGALYFDRTRDISLDAFYILVNGGYFEVGTHENPYLKKAIITLHGDRYKSIELPNIGSKVLAVCAKGMPGMSANSGIRTPGRNVGQLEVHGKPRLRTWTKLNSTAYAGSYIFVTSEPVDFAPGETIVLTGSEAFQSSFDLPQFQYEEMTVEENIDGYQIKLTEPLKFTHRSEIISVEGRTIDLRVEVALISRNVIIQGDEKSNEQLFGVHTVVMMNGIYRVENAEVRQCGQAFNLGRYPLHTHRAGNMEGSYVKANSIHNSFQRAVTTHESHNWEVRDNVAFDIQGHALFVEDGSELLNTLSGNLGILVRRSSALLESDMKPAVFWTASPENFFYDNVAVHSFMFGFWFELRQTHPFGSNTPDMCPNHRHLGMFKNNTIRGCSSIGFRIYPEYTPLVEPCNERSAPYPVDFHELLSYRNGGNGFFSKRHGDLHHHNFVVLENLGDEISIVKHPFANYTDYPNFINLLAIATLDPPNDPQFSSGKLALNLPHSEYFYVKDATFVNYGISGAITACNDCLGGEDTHQGAFTTRFSGLKFVNSPKKIIWTETKKEIFWDLDGSLAGKPDFMITRFQPYNNWPECTRLSKAEFDDSSQCRRIRRIAIDNVEPNNVHFTDISIISSAGTGAQYFLPLDIYGWVAAVADNHNYTLEWKDAKESPTQFRLEWGRGPYLLEAMNKGEKEEVTFVFSPNQWDYVPYTFDIVNVDTITSASISPLSVLKNNSQARYVNNTLSILYNFNSIKQSNTSSWRSSIYSTICPPIGCTYPAPPNPTIPHLWSNETTWKIVGLNHYPEQFEDITIPSNVWVVLDVIPPKLGCIYVYGKLSFVQEKQFSVDLRVTCLVVYGYMEILGPDNTPFDGNVTITVYGGMGQTLPVVIGNKIYPGSKVIPVLGYIKAKGNVVAKSWTKLASAALLGSKTISISGPVDWVAGQEIVISPTAYYNSAGKSRLEPAGKNAEVVKIASISGSTITLASALTQDHICHREHESNFCGYVGMLSRSVNFQSADSENPSSTSYGFGAHLMVLDYNPGKGYKYTGYIEMDNVAFSNMGKIDSSHYAITMRYKLTIPQNPSRINNCVFNNNYNFAINIVGAKSVNITNNIAVSSTGGGIFVDKSSSGITILNNLVIDVYQLPSTLLSTYAWNRPIASFSCLSSSCVIKNNVAAGSVDSGFYLAQALFTKRADSRNCLNTHGNNMVVYGNLSRLASVYNNEAVGCQVGVTLVTVSSSESSSTDCAVLGGFKVWRNSHAGFMSADTVANVLIADSVIAENHLGISLHFFKFSSDAFSGLVGSKVIGTLQTSSQCGLGDSNWASQCRAFSEDNPLATKNICESELSESVYDHVGLMLPQWTDGPRTCAMAGRFAVCDPPTTADRLCGLPMNNRFGVPVGIQYPEQHIHNTLFANFYTRPKCSTNRNGTAVSFIGDQIDQQPSIFMSGISWSNVDGSAKFGFDVSQSKCTDNPCSGHNLIIIHDFDGSVTSRNPGQIYYNNPAYAAPTNRGCSSASDLDSVTRLGAGFFYCDSSVSNPFQQYHATWHDKGPQVLQPLVVSRQFDGESKKRSFSTFGPTFESCTKHMFFSRYPFFLATNMVNYVQTTGTNPSSWVIRWDAPENAATIVNLFITQSVAYNVFIGQSENDPNYVLINPLTSRDPILTDPAGTYVRNPQNRSLTILMRGGSKRFYKFQQIPLISVTMRIATSFSSFFGPNFIANLALLLGLDASQIKIVNVSPGAVITPKVHPVKGYEFSFESTSEQGTNIQLQITDIAPPVVTTSTVKTQISNLQSIGKSLSDSVSNGEMQNSLGTTVYQTFATVPVQEVPFDNTVEVNQTEYRKRIISENTPWTYTVELSPTGSPTGSPTSQPTLHALRWSQFPTLSPTQIPTSQPSASTKSNQINIGLIIGVVVGGSVVLLTLLLVLLYLRSKQSQKKEGEENIRSGQDNYSDRAGKALSVMVSYDSMLYDRSAESIKPFKLSPKSLKMYSERGFKIDNTIGVNPQKSNDGEMELTSQNPKENASKVISGNGQYWEDDSDDEKDNNINENEDKTNNKKSQMLSQNYTREPNFNENNMNNSNSNNNKLDPEEMTGTKPVWPWLNENK